MNRYLAGIALLILLPVPGSAAPPVVRVVKEGDGYRLERDGTPYLIKGAGGEGSPELLAKLGGNSVRTWGTDNLDKRLDEAHKQGISVAVGIWFGHERHGFNYNDADQVAGQLESVKQAVLRYKDHPAVLLWGLGNEMEGYAKGDNAAIWSVINNAATLVKKLDPNHPTMTVIAEIGGDRVKNIHRLCPDVDIVGINCYGGVATLPERYRQAGGEKPYIVTEFGPPGVWETKKNAWGSAPEFTSTEKATYYRKGYESAVLGSKGLCLGSYAFTWGAKQEATATWFGILLPDGTRLGAADTLSELWTGKPLANRCPEIKSLKLVGDGEVEPGATIEATLDASDPDNDPRDVKWLLQREAVALGTGGDAEEAPPTFPEAIIKADAKRAEVRMPKEGGPYRLFATVRDGKGGAAVGNVQLRVKGQVPVTYGKKAELPLIVYDDAERKNPAYTPSGFMGNTKALKLDPTWAKKPHAGASCIRIEFSANDGWGGIVWQSPANDWDDRSGGFDLTGAKQLSFWARGENGGEVVTFEFGLIAKEKPFPDTARGKLDKVKLTKEWKQYTIDLKGLDLRRVKTGFACVVAGNGAPLVFFLDDIRYE